MATSPLFCAYYRRVKPEGGEINLEDLCSVLRRRLAALKDPKHANLPLITEEDVRLDEFSMHLFLLFVCLLDSFFPHLTPAKTEVIVHAWRDAERQLFLHRLRTLPGILKHKLAYDCINSKLHHELEPTAQGRGVPEFATTPLTPAELAADDVLHGAYRNAYFPVSRQREWHLVPFQYGIPLLRKRRCVLWRGQLQIDVKDPAMLFVLAAYNFTLPARSYIGHGPDMHYKSMDRRLWSVARTVLCELGKWAGFELFSDRIVSLTEPAVTVPLTLAPACTHRMLESQRHFQNRERWALFELLRPHGYTAEGLMKLMRPRLEKTYGPARAPIEIKGILVSWKYQEKNPVAAGKGPVVTCNVLDKMGMCPFAAPHIDARLRQYECLKHHGLSQREFRLPVELLRVREAAAAAASETAETKEAPTPPLPLPEVVIHTNKRVKCQSPPPSSSAGLRRAASAPLYLRVPQG